VTFFPVYHEKGMDEMLKVANKGREAQGGGEGEDDSRLEPIVEMKKAVEGAEQLVAQVSGASNDST
jgi:hypothetical protein